MQLPTHDVHPLKLKLQKDQLTRYLASLIISQIGDQSKTPHVSEKVVAMSVHFQAKSREDSEFEFHQTPLDFGWIQSGRGWMKKKEKGVDQAMSQSPTLHGTRSIDAECSPLKADEYAKEGKDGLCCALVCPCLGV